MSLFNRKVTLSASNLVSISIVNQVLSSLWEKGEYRLLNLSLRSSKDNVGGIQCLKIDAKGDLWRTKQDYQKDFSSKAEITFYLQNFDTIWQLHQKYRIARFKCGYGRDEFKLKFENDKIVPWEDLDIAKMNDLHKYYPKSK